MPRWTLEQKQKLAQMREILGNELTDRPQFPEVVGERRMMRFIRGYEYDVEKASAMFLKSLRWRKEKNIDEIRNSIVTGGMNRPNLFPKGDIITKLMPAIAIAPHLTDKHPGRHPIVVDQYSFSVAEMRASITDEDYLTFVTHVLEYRSIIIDQISEEREQAHLASLTPEERAEAMDESIEVTDDHVRALMQLLQQQEQRKQRQQQEGEGESEGEEMDEDSGSIGESVAAAGAAFGGFVSSYFTGWGSTPSPAPASAGAAAAASPTSPTSPDGGGKKIEKIIPVHLKPYGVLAEYVVIRDLCGLGLEHIGSDGQAMVSAVISIAADNYPEVMFKTFCINTPWVFSTLWWFIQGMLSARTVAKINVLGTDFLTTIADDIDPSNLPSLIGGPVEVDPDYVYPFDLEYLNSPPASSFELNKGKLLSPTPPLTDEN